MPTLSKPLKINQITNWQVITYANFRLQNRRQDQILELPRFNMFTWKDNEIEKVVFDHTCMKPLRCSSISPSQWKINRIYPVCHEWESDHENNLGRHKTRKKRNIIAVLLVGKNITKEYTQEVYYCQVRRKHKALKNCLHVDSKTIDSRSRNPYWMGGKVSILDCCMNRQDLRGKSNFISLRFLKIIIWY